MIEGSKMALQELTDYLGKHHINFSMIDHEPAYTAQETAQCCHIPGKMLAKTVIVKMDDKLAMIVLPANYQIDLKRLQEETDCKKLRLANESDFTEQFPKCEVGAMPPFGNLYGMDVYVDKALTKDKEIAFNAGSHSELMQLSYDDFARLVKPKIMRIH